jgi:hypothetical protein
VITDTKAFETPGASICSVEVFDTGTGGSRLKETFVLKSKRSNINTNEMRSACSRKVTCMSYALKLF